MPTWPLHPMGERWTLTWRTVDPNRKAVCSTPPDRSVLTPVSILPDRFGGGVTCSVDACVCAPTNTADRWTSAPINSRKINPNNTTTVLFFESELSCSAQFSLLIFKMNNDDKRRSVKKEKKGGIPCKNNK